MKVEIEELEYCLLGAEKNRGRQHAKCDDERKGQKASQALSYFQWAGPQ